METEAAATTISAAQAFGQYLLPMLLGAGGVAMFALGFGHALAALRVAALALIGAGLLLSGTGPVQAQTVERWYLDFTGVSNPVTPGPNATGSPSWAGGRWTSTCQYNVYKVSNYPQLDTANNYIRSNGQNFDPSGLMACLYVPNTPFTQFGQAYTENNNQNWNQNCIGKRVYRWERVSGAQYTGNYVDVNNGLVQEYHEIELRLEAGGAVCGRITGPVYVARVKKTTAAVGSPEDKTCQVPNSSPTAGISGWDYFDSSKHKSGDRVYQTGGSCYYFLNNCKPYTCKAGDICRLKRIDGSIENLDSVCQLFASTKSIKDGADLTGAHVLLTPVEIAKIVRDAWDETPPPIGKPDAVPLSLADGGPFPVPETTKPASVDPIVTAVQKLPATTVDHDPRDCNTAFYHPGNRASDGSCIGAFERDHPEAKETPPSPGQNQAWCWTSHGICKKEELSVLDPGGNPIPYPTWQAQNPGVQPSWPVTYNPVTQATVPAAPVQGDGTVKPPTAGDGDGDGVADAGDGSDLYKRKTTGTIGEAWKAEVDALRAQGGLGAGLVAAFDLSGSVETGDWCKSLTVPGAFMQASSVNLCIPAKYLDLLYTLNIMLASWGAVMLTISRGS